MVFCCAKGTGAGRIFKTPQPASVSLRAQPVLSDVHWQLFSVSCLQTYTGFLSKFLIHGCVGGERRGEGLVEGGRGVGRNIENA